MRHMTLDHFVFVSAESSARKYCGYVDLEKAQVEEIKS